MSVDLLLSWWRTACRVWASVSGLFRRRAPAAAQPVSPAGPVYPRLDPKQYERRLRNEILEPRYANVPDDPTTAANERKTFCNLFTRAVCGWYGWKDFESPDRDQAGEITRYMRAHPKVWRQVSNLEAASLASNGHLVIAGQEQKVPPPTGHVCIVAPGDPVYSNKWGTNVPIVANVGGDNFYGKALSFAFGKEPPQLYLYVGRAA